MRTGQGVGRVEAYLEKAVADWVRGDCAWRKRRARCQMQEEEKGRGGGRLQCKQRDVRVQW